MYLKTLSPVIAFSALVKLDSQAIKDLAKEIALEDYPLLPVRDKNLFPAKDNDDFIQFICISTAINCCFTDPWSRQKFETKFNDNTYKGSEALNASLMRAIQDGWEILNWRNLIKISEMQCGYIFRGKFTIPLLRERVQILNDIGLGLSKYGGSFTDLFRQNDFQAFGNTSVKGIVPTLAYEFPLVFEDAPYWQNGVISPKKIYFRKKAQLLVLLYNNRALTSNNSLQIISDIHKIGPIADYNVPRSLVDKNCLQYNADLSKKINSRTILSPSSREEIEIRANSVAALTILLHEINMIRRENQLTPIHHGHLDARMWLLGQQSKTPQHLTPTTAY